MFTATPASGIDDLYFKGAYALPVLHGLTAVVMHHDFAADHGGAGLGSEWDASLELAVDGHTSLLFAVADYQGSGALKDKAVAWVQAAYHL